MPFASHYGSTAGFLLHPKTPAEPSARIGGFTHKPKLSPGQIRNRLAGAFHSERLDWA
jgi:hypothetical protein